MRPKVLVAGTAAALAPAVLGTVAGHEFHFEIFYFLPVALFAWQLGRRAGLLMAGFTAALSVMAALRHGHAELSHAPIYLNAVVVFSGGVAGALLISRVASNNSARTRIETTDPVELDAAFARATMRKLEADGQPRR